MITSQKKKNKKNKRISLYLPSNKPLVPKWVYSNSFFAIHYMQMRVLFHTNVITGGICISLELVVLLVRVPAMKVIQSIPEGI